MSRIGVLTGGGDCPGLNAVIRAVVRKGIKVHGHDFLGFRYGWAGVLEGDCAQLTYESTRGILHRGGTILGTSRTNPYKEDGGLEQLKAMLAEQGVDALIPIGGEDTLGVARRLMDDGVNVVGVPKTIDNDLAGTDFTFGFQTAVQIATDAIDRLHTTAESHNRVIIVEVMGRHAGWIALLLRPRRRRGRDPRARAAVRPRRVCERLSAARPTAPRSRSSSSPRGRRPRTATSGASTAARTPSAGAPRRHRRRARARDRGAHGLRVAHDVLGHVQRGGTPLAYDRVLGTRFGSRPSTRSPGDLGMMTALRGTDRARPARRGDGRAEAARPRALRDRGSLLG